jgi:hypothetical protein
MAGEYHHEGIDYDIENNLRLQLNRDHQVLHVGYVRLKQGKKWGSWDLERIIRYHAKVVRALRKMGYEYPVTPVEEGKDLKRELDIKSEGTLKEGVR